MFRFLSFNKKQTGIIVTLVVLIFLGACYFFMYVPANEKTVQERRFRCLQNISDNIHSKLDNSVSLLNNMLTSHIRPSGRDDKDKRKAIDDLKVYIDHYPQTNFTLHPIASGKPNKILSDKGDSIVTIRSYPYSQRFSISLSKIISDKENNPTDSLSIGMSYRFDQFVKSLLVADVFDNYVVFFNYKSNRKKDKAEKENNNAINSEVVYETFHSGLNYKEADSLLIVKKGVASPGVKSFTIGGTDYKAFSQPVRIGDNELIIMGLASDGNYQKEKNQLPLGVVLLLLTAAISLIILLPLIKLYHMGNKDKLTVSDGIACVLVSMLMISLIFFVFFKYSLYLNKSYNEGYSLSAKSLATKITTEFENNLNSAYKRLYTFDSVYTCENVKTDVKNLGKPRPVYENKQKYPQADKILRANPEDLIMRQVYWLDKTGAEINNWSADTLYIPRSNLGSREYFINAIKNKFNSTGSPKFYLDQVVSRTSGDFTSVIAINSQDDSAKVAAMSFTAKSLDSVVMPDGYMFAIIDQAGEVRYHSLAARNLNENLKSEFADSSNLVSGLQAKSDTTFNAEYYGRQYNIEIKPFAHLPYFTVIFEDLEYNNARDTEAYASTIALLICLVIFLICQLVVVVIVSSKKSLFKKQLFDTSWIGPKISSHHQYNQIVFGNFVIIILIVFFSLYSTFLEYLYITLFSISYVAIFSNCIFALYYYKSNNTYYGYFKRITIQWFCLFAVIIDYVAWKTLDTPNFVHLILFEVLAIVFSGLFYIFSASLLNKGRKPILKVIRKWNYTHSFALMATTRLIITNGIPVAFFFIFSFNYEQNLDTRYRQLTFARDLSQKLPQQNNPSHKDSLNAILKKTTGIYYDGRFINTVNFVDKGDTPLSFSK